MKKLSRSDPVFSFLFLNILPKCPPPEFYTHLQFPFSLPFSLFFLHLPFLIPHRATFPLYPTPPLKKKKPKKKPGNIQHLPPLRPPLNLSLSPPPPTPHPRPNRPLLFLHLFRFRSRLCPLPRHPPLLPTPPTPSTPPTPPTPPTPTLTPHHRRAE